MLKCVFQEQGDAWHSNPHLKSFLDTAGAVDFEANIQKGVEGVAFVPTIHAGHLQSSL